MSLNAGERDSYAGERNSYSGEHVIYSASFSRRDEESSFHRRETREVFLRFIFMKLLIFISSQILSLSVFFRILWP